MKKKIFMVVFVVSIMFFSFNSVYAADKVTCGKIGSFNNKIPELTSWVISIAQILVPVILVIMGSIDLVKAISSQKDDEIKKGQKIFVKRLITAILIFFIVSLVKMLVSVIGTSADKDSVSSCIDCFISNNCK